MKITHQERMMTIHKRVLFYLLTCMGCFLALPAVATADIDEGNYTVSYTDYVSPDQFVVLGRTYNSITQTSGQLGYGWGSSFETYLTVVGARGVRACFVHFSLFLMDVGFNRIIHSYTESLKQELAQAPFRHD